MRTRVIAPSCRDSRFQQMSKLLAAPPLSQRKRLLCIELLQLALQHYGVLLPRLPHTPARLLLAAPSAPTPFQRGARLELCDIAVSATTHSRPKEACFA